MVVIICIPSVIMPRIVVFYVAKYWGLGVQFLLKYCVNITYEVRGRENLPQTPVIVASKHQSAWETTMIHVLVPGCAIILKHELTWIPLFGQLLLKSNAITLQRARGSKIIPQLVEQAKKRLAAGQSVFIFPEGTRRPVDAPARYKSGIAAVYQETHVPVVPAAHNAGFFWARRDFIKKPGKIVFEFLPPIQPGLDGDLFMKKLTDAIETAANKLRPTEEPDSKDHKPTPRKSKRFLFLVLIVLLSFGGYTVMWKNASTHLESLIKRQLDDLHHKGVTVDYQSLAMTGFPLSLQANFKGLTLKIHHKGILNIRVDHKFIIRSSLWDSKRLQFMTKGPITINHADLIIPTHDLIEIKRLNGVHILDEAEENYLVSLEDISFAKTLHEDQPKASLEKAEIEWTKRKLTADSKEDPYVFDMSFHNLRWIDHEIKGLGSTIEKAHVKGSLNTFWTLIDGSLKDRAMLWVHDQGNLDISHLEMVWGPLRVEANGALSLGDKLQPVASFAGKLFGLENLIDIFQEEKLIDKKTGAVAKLGLGLFKESDPLHPDQVFHRISFGIQNGMVSLGPINLMKIPPINWDHLTASPTNK